MGSIISKIGQLHIEITKTGALSKQKTKAKSDTLIKSSHAIVAAPSSTKMYCIRMSVSQSEIRDDRGRCHDASVPGAERADLIARVTHVPCNRNPKGELRTGNRWRHPGQDRSLFGLRALSYRVGATVPNSSVSSMKSGQD
jgi:hypothetical protein